MPIASRFRDKLTNNICVTDRCFMFLEGGSSDEVIADLPPERRSGTRALPLEIFSLPE